MSFDSVICALPDAEGVIVKAVKAKADQMLDHSPRFRFFTLHGKEHLDSLFRTLGILIEYGIQIPQRELYLLCLAICTHDLGMVVSLRDYEFDRISEGRPGFSDPVAFERFVRDTHHELISEYMSRDLNFLIGLGITPPDLTTITAIGMAHRRINLDSLVGIEQRLGALMRVIDELDVGPNRAPARLLENIADEIDNISVWHWYKHNITLDWDLGHNVNSVEHNRAKSIQFDIAVRPPTRDSIPYWLTQVHRPIRKALIDEGAERIIHAHYGVLITAQRSDDLSRASGLKGMWIDLEHRALSHDRKVILIVDDEVAKYDDSFYPLMENFHVVRAPNPKAAIAALEAMPVALAVVDLQMGAGGLWSEIETADFKLTGIQLARTINERFPSVQVGILTGTRHKIPALDDLKLAFFLKKPIMPDELCKRVTEDIEGKRQV